MQRDGSRLAEGLRAVDVHVASLLTTPPEASNLTADAQQNVGMAVHNTQADVHRNLAFQVGMHVLWKHCNDTVHMH